MACIYYFIGLISLFSLFPFNVNFSMDIDGMHLISVISLAVFKLKLDVFWLGVNKILINCNNGAKILYISVAANLFIVVHEFVL